MIPIEQACYWLANRTTTPFTTLTGTARADIAVVGAGLTGLWSAIYLKTLSPESDVAIIEQGCAAYGASGRNAGMLAETIDHSHELAIEHFGEAEAKILARLGRDNIDEMLAWLTEHQIDCDFEPSGRLLVALSASHNEALQQSANTAARLGVSGYQQLTKAETQAELNSPLYQGGLYIPFGGILDPVKLVDGLRAIALKKGVRIYEQSRVESLTDQRSQLELNTAAGSLRAGKVILAMSAYTHHLMPGVRWRFIPLYDYIIVSERLTPEQLASIGWRRRQGVSDIRNFFLYYRLTRDNRILWGTSEAVYYRGNRVDQSLDHSESHYQSLRKSFRDHFPQLAGLQFQYAWGGAICATTRLTPFFGSAYRGKLYYGLGYTGHGLGSTHLVGKLLAHLSLSRSHQHLSLSLARRKPFPYPPEPLRGLAVSMVTDALRDVDQGQSPNLLLRLLARMGIGFSS